MGIPHLDHLDAPLPLPREIKVCPQLKGSGQRAAPAGGGTPPSQKKAAPNKGENKPQSHPKALRVALQPQRFPPAACVSSSRAERGRILLCGRRDGDKTKGIFPF